jgi:hypothetical protein
MYYVDVGPHFWIFSQNTRAICEKKEAQGTYCLYQYWIFMQQLQYVAPFMCWKHLFLFDIICCYHYYFTHPLPRHTCGHGALLLIRGWCSIKIPFNRY